jgi:hypothetical protein
MSHNSLTKFDRPLQIELRPSAQLAVCIGLVHALSAVAVVFFANLPMLRLLLPLLLLANLGYFVRSQITTRSRLAVRAIAWDRQRGWRVANALGDWQSVQLRRPVFISYRLVVVRFRVSRFKTRSAVIVADRLSVDEFRRLRSRLMQVVRNQQAC